MAHQRQIIRDAVVAILVDKTVAGDRVIATRFLPYRKNDLPAISVYTLEDTVAEESKDTAPRELTRELRLEIAGWVAPGPDVDDAMDDLALEIETAMHADPYLTDTAADSILQTSKMGIRGDGDSLMGLITLTYGVTYRTLAPEAPTGLDDFLRADVIYKPAGNVPADDVAEDKIILEGP